MALENNVIKGRSRRSGDRCHLITRVPVYDNKGRTVFYHFHYTAGTLYKPDALEIRHIRHVLMGFYVRRNMDMFTEPGGNALLTLPLSPEIEKNLGIMPTSRILLRLPQRQDYSFANNHIVNVLRKNSMQLAADIYTIIYTNWARSLRSFNYIVLDMKSDVQEQLHLAKNIKKFSPNVKLICDNVSSESEIDDAFRFGADLVCYAGYPKFLSTIRFNEDFHRSYPEAMENAFSMLMELLNPHPQYDMFSDLLRKYPFLRPHVPRLLNFTIFCDELEKDNYINYEKCSTLYKKRNLEEDLVELDRHSLNSVISIICAMLLSFQFESNENLQFNVFSYEPFKIALIRAKFADLLLYTKGDDEVVKTQPVFQTAMGSCFPMLIDESRRDHVLVDMLNKAVAGNCAMYEDLRKTLDCAKAVEEIKISVIDELTSQKEDNKQFFELKKIAHHYEDALIWTTSVIKILSKSE